MKDLAGPARTGTAAGGATVELLVILPILLITLAMGVDEARMMRAAVALDSAVQMGVLAGVIKLKDKNFKFNRETDGSITVPAGVTQAMADTAVLDAADYTIQVTTTNYLCRCPDPTTYMVGNHVPCTDNAIKSCQDPQIYLTMTATTQVDMVLKVPGADPHLLLTRSALMCAH